MKFQTAITLPREAFGPAHVAKAADVWRALQQVAVLASHQAGWTPRRFVSSESAFVLRSMNVLYRHPLRYGDSHGASTWISRVRRGVLWTRELVIEDRVVASQEWVHIDGSHGPAKASEALLASFLPVDERPPLVLPTTFPVENGAHFTRTWTVMYAWVDPLAHANHPIFLELCDEALAVWLSEAGEDPFLLAPVAEEVVFLRPLFAGDRVVVETTEQARIEGGRMFSHRLLVADQVAARVTTYRTHPSWL